MTGLEKGKKGLVAKGKATSKVELRLTLGVKHNSSLEILNVISKSPQLVHTKNHIIIEHTQHSQVHWETPTCYLNVYTVKVLGRWQHLPSCSGNLHL